MSKVALITGATSGIGQSAARAFVAAGWKVVATGRRAGRLTALTDELGADNLHPLAFDMRDEEAIAAALAGLPPAFAGIDLLINNAGLALGTAPAQSAKLSDWRQMIDTNVTGLVTITHQLLPGLIARKGAIINLSSVAATYPYTGGNAYGGTKAFVRQFSLGLRSDLAGTGVRVTSIEPGMVDTEFTLWVAQLPAHLNINTLELMPVSQSFAGFAVAREG
jgi:serine 3-dehydrogenase